MLDAATRWRTSLHTTVPNVTARCPHASPYGGGVTASPTKAAEDEKHKRYGPKITPIAFSTYRRLGREGRNALEALGAEAHWNSDDPSTQRIQVAKWRKTSRRPGPLLSDEQVATIRANRVTEEARHEALRAQSYKFEQSKQKEAEKQGRRNSRNSTRSATTTTTTQTTTGVYPKRAHFFGSIFTMGPSGQPMSATQRRRGRRLRAALRHERQSIAMALAECTHHF